jgi:hypothetical protein
MPITDWKIWSEDGDMGDESETTEEKITKLQSSFPESSVEALLELLVSCEGDTERVKELLGVKKNGRGISVQSTLKRFMTPAVGEDKRVFKHLDTGIKGKTYHVYDPDEVKKLLPCTFHLKLFPKELADKLLQGLLKDSESWKSREFYLFERKVRSHHTTALYAEAEGFTTEDATYNGLPAMHVYPFSKELVEARNIIQDIVNEEIIKRGLAKYQYPGEWVSGIAVCNKYEGREETVGYHSDQMTHLGPHCVIASVSLGATREFRLKDRHDREKSTISIHVPHNSMVIMHAGCQEEYKHSLVPTTDAITPHPLSGTARINITFRMYLDDFKTERLPRCECDYPMLLRTTIARDHNYKYIWQCSGAYNNGTGCSKIIWPSFKENVLDASEGS